MVDEGNVSAAILWSVRGQFYQPQTHLSALLRLSGRKSQKKKEIVIFFFQFIEAASAHSEKLKTGCETDTGLHLVWHLSTDQQRKTQN